MASALGLVQIATPEEVLAESEFSDADDFEVSDPLEFADGIVRYVHECWSEAYRFKQQHHEKRFIEAMYARRGEYTPNKLRQIQQLGGSVEYARIVANKSRVLESWLKDIFLAQGEQPWTIEATPDPALHDDVMQDVKREVADWLAQMVAQGQSVSHADVLRHEGDRIDAERIRIRDEAESRAKRMESRIADQLEDGGFRLAFSEFIAHLTTYPAAVMKGPIFRKKSRIAWEDVDGTHIPNVSDEIVMEFESVNPFNIYPAPGAESPQDGYIFEHISLTTRDLYELIGVDYYDEARIRKVLERARLNGGLRWIAHDVSDQGDESNAPYVRNNTSNVGYVDVLEFHGPVSGVDLAEWGVTGIDDPQRFYEATVWLVDTEVIKATLNDDPMGRRPYYKACYESIPGQFWGYSMHDALADVQGVCNAAIRSLVNNMAIASGPQVTVNVDRLPPNEDITNIYPWKIWQVNDSQFNSTSNPAVDFYQPNTNVNELLMVLDKFYALSDDFSMIPRYMSGSDKISGPGRTASGLSMLLDAANKGLKSIVQSIDQNVMTPMLNQLFDHNMIYSDDETIKGDSQIVARGVASLMQLETLRMRRNEFLQITANPIDSEIVGTEGRATVLREVAKTLGLDVNKIVPPNAGQIAQQKLEVHQGQQAPNQSQEKLADGAPVTDIASPSSMV